MVAHWRNLERHQKKTKKRRRPKKLQRTKSSKKVESKKRKKREKKQHTCGSTPTQPSTQCYTQRLAIASAIAGCVRLLHANFSHARCCTQQKKRNVSAAVKYIKERTTGKKKGCTSPRSNSKMSSRITLSIKTESKNTTYVSKTPASALHCPLGICKWDGGPAQGKVGWSDDVALLLTEGCERGIRRCAGGAQRRESIFHL